jgi:hypothetical protein
VQLDDRARAALEAVRRQASWLRFEVERICDSRRHRLSVRYGGAGYRGSASADHFRLGLAYSDDPEPLERLRLELEEEERRRGPR